MHDDVAAPLVAEVIPGSLNRVPLTGDVQFGAQGHETIPLAVYNGSQSLARILLRGMTPQYQVCVPSQPLTSLSSIPYHFSLLAQSL